ICSTSPIMILLMEGL
ncbi:unnamed protein product, partial [Oikopleura dioica]